jgi:DNA-binding MarR family transcriptional regulator
VVRRVPSDSDGRAWLLEPTTTAMRKRLRIENTITIVEAECFGSLTATERRELLHLLDKATARLEAAS